LHPASPGLLLACHRHKGSLRPWPGRLARPRPRCVLACLPACLPSAWSPAASAATSCLFSHHPPQGAPPPKTTGPRRSGGRPIQVRGREGSTADCRLIIRAGGIRGGPWTERPHAAAWPVRPPLPGRHLKGWNGRLNSRSLRFVRVWGASHVPAAEGRGEVEEGAANGTLAIGGGVDAPVKWSWRRLPLGRGARLSASQACGTAASGAPTGMHQRAPACTCRIIDH